MTIGTTPMNTGLIMQNQAVIKKANQKLLGKSTKKLQENATGTLRELSEEEVKELHTKAKNESRTLQADSSEIVNNVYSKTGDNITYEIDGVLFSNEEMKRCKELVKQAISELPVIGSDLDYEDYAAMGLAENMVGTYAKEHLTGAQAKVVERSFSDYLDKLVAAEKERQLGEEYSIDETEGVGPTGELNKYYAVRCRLSAEAAESLKSQLTTKLPEQTTNTLLANLEHAQTSGSVVQSASNAQLAETIRELFKAADFKDAASVNSAYGRYKELMIPAYQSYGVVDTERQKSLTNVLNQDINRFAVQVTKAKTVLGSLGSSMNVRV